MNPGDIQQINLAATDPALHEFTVVIPELPEGNPYRLKIVYDQISSESGCSLFEMRIASKPLENLINETLSCRDGNEAPPEEIIFK
jgi:hypothetical protein